MNKKKYNKKAFKDDLDDLEELYDLQIEDETDEIADDDGFILPESDSDEFDEEDDVLEEEEEIPEVPAKVKKKALKEKFYVEPKLFDEEIMKYYDSGVMTNELAEMVSKISHKLSYASNFINYSYREEMVGDGIIRMMKALISKKYNRTKGTNPFSYFTRIAFNAFRNRIKKEKHIHETHEKYKEELMFMSGCVSNLNKNKNGKKNINH
jgi:translation elongation factor EF-G